MIESPDKSATRAHSDHQNISMADQWVFDLHCCRFILLIAHERCPILSGPEKIKRNAN